MATLVDHDADFMRRAIRLAMNGRGGVEPNPMVGCVIVKNGRVIGEGYHQRYGGPHAEPNALANCSESPAGATAYVTLEPCCHVNKQTPPCVPRLIEAKLGRVVVGCLDPNPEVNGKGVQQLREAGIVVDGPVLEKEAKQLIAAFIARMVERRPYVTLKWAQTADGKIAGAGGSRMQISNQTSGRVVHGLRSRCEAIVVGSNTVLVDDPMLTVRGVVGEGNSQKLRIVLDRLLRVSPRARIFLGGEGATTVRVYHGSGAASERIREFERAGVEVRLLPESDDGRLSLSGLLADVYGDRVTHLLVEPGPTLARSFIKENLVDRIWVIRSGWMVQEQSALSATEIPGDYVETGRVDLDGDLLTEYLNTRSLVFFATEKSGDFVFANEDTSR